jgi:hypothetical protein
MSFVRHQKVKTRCAAKKIQHLCFGQFSRGTYIKVDRGVKTVYDGKRLGYQGPLLAANFPTKGLCSKRRISPCIFQVVAFLSTISSYLLVIKLGWTPNVIGWFVVTWLEINAMFPAGQQVKNCCPPRPATCINKQNGGPTSIIRNHDFPSLCSNKECKREEKYTTGNRICCWNRLSRFF